MTPRVHHARWLGCAAALLLLAPVVATAQSGDANAIDAAVTAVIGRARTLADAGDGTQARTLLDSLVNNTEPASNALAEALYWRAVLSERAADAERDWKRLAVETPLSSRAPDALLKLGDIEILRGRPPAARAYLERLLRDYGDAPQRPKAMLMVARSYFEERNNAQACATIDSLRARGVPEGETQLQSAEMARRCQTANGNAVGLNATSPVPEPALPATTTPASNTPTGKGATKYAEAKPTSEAKSRTQYAVQVAAYDTRAQADAVVKRLAKRGWKAHIDGERKPYRVRVGRFDTRAEAVALLAKLKKQGQKGFVAELNP